MKIAEYKIKVDSAGIHKLYVRKNPLDDNWSFVDFLQISEGTPSTVVEEKVKATLSHFGYEYDFPVHVEKEPKEEEIPSPVVPPHMNPSETNVREIKMDGVTYVKVRKDGSVGDDSVGDESAGGDSDSISEEISYIRKELKKAFTELTDSRTSMGLKKDRLPIYGMLCQVAQVYLDILILEQNNNK